MNNFKKFFCVAFVFLFILTQSNTGAAIASNPSDLTLSETKIYSTATVADDFVDNHVLVVLTNEASLQFQDYSPEDFPEIDCLQTEDLTKSVAPMVQMKVNSMNGVQPAATTYELGQLNVPVPVLHKLADLYGVSTDYLLGRTNQKAPYPKR